MPGYDSTARVPFAKGGRVGLKKGNDVPHGLKEVKRKKWYEPGIGINVATGQRKKPDLGGELPEDIKAKTDKPGFSAGYTWNPDYRPKGKRLEQVADKGVYVHEAPTKDRKGDKTWKTRQKEKKLKLKKEVEKKKRFEVAEERTKQRKKGNYAEGGRIGLKKGGDDKWIQKVDASIKRRGTKGKCTPITKPGCTGRAKALAKTFKKMAKKRKAA